MYYKSLLLLGLGYVVIVVPCYSYIQLLDVSEFYQFKYI